MSDLPRPIRVVALDTDPEALAGTRREKEAAEAANVVTPPAGHDAFRPGRLKHGPQVCAWCRLPPFQRLAMPVPGHEPSRHLERLEQIWAVSAGHRRSVAPGWKPSANGRLDHWKNFARGLDARAAPWIHWEV
jgi:hypothetical protein